MSDKAFQLYERALRNLKNSVGRAWARCNESQIRVRETPPIFHPHAQRNAFRRARDYDNFRSATH